MFDLKNKNAFFLSFYKGKTNKKNNIKSEEKGIVIF